MCETKDIKVVRVLHVEKEHSNPGLRVHGLVLREGGGGDEDQQGDEESEQNEQNEQNEEDASEKP